jgi:hypothetical protein
MKVWMCKRTDDFGGFSGGLAVVAANSKEEAFKIFFEDRTYDWIVHKIDVDNGDYIEYHTKWKSYYYPLENWFECNVLTANVDKPCVIIEDGYSE